MSSFFVMYTTRELPYCYVRYVSVRLALTMLLVEIIFEIFWDWECQLDSLQKAPNQQTDFHQLQAFLHGFT